MLNILKTNNKYQQLLTEHNRVKINDKLDYNMLGIGFEIKKILHVSDIHIRRTSEHVSEYRAVFNKLYTIMKQNQNNSILVVTGDTLHSKCCYTDYSNNVFNDFVIKTAEIMPTFYLFGNHDGSLIRSRRDGLESLLQLAQYHNIYYLKYSGFYSFGNILFCVSSIFDDKFITQDDMRDLQSKMNVNRAWKTIGLYHGAVYSPNSNVLVNIPTSHHIDDFSIFDYTMLGDIHKHYFLAPNCAYSGSLIQQNHGEIITGHGIIIWDIENNNHQFVEIPNDYGYITIHVDNQRIITPDIIPSKPRIQVIYENTTLQRCKDLISRVIPQAIERNYKQKPKTQIAIPNSSSLAEINLTDQFIIYCQSQNIDPTKYIEIHNKYIQQTDVPKPQANWTLKELEFANMFCYDRYNKIDFTRCEKIVNIAGINGSGKTSLVDILTYMITDRHSKQSINDNIINERCDKFYCMLSLLIDTKIYKIVKYGARGKKFNVLFFLLLGDEFINLTEPDKCQTLKTIAKYFGSYDDLTMRNVFLQKRESNFTNLTKLEQFNYLLRVFDLNCFSDVHTKLKVNIKELELKAASFCCNGNNDLHRDIDELNNRRSILVQRIDDINPLGAQWDKNTLNRVLEIINEHKMGTTVKSGLLKKIEKEMGRGCDLVKMYGENVGIQTEIELLDSVLIEKQKALICEEQRIVSGKILDDELKLLEEYKKLISRGGVQRFLLSERIKELESAVNDILASLTNFSVEILITGNGDYISVDIVKTGAGELPFSSLCQTEVVYFNIAFKLGVLGLRGSCDFLIFDETFASFDKENSERAIRLYDKIGEYCSLALIIAHSETLTDPINQTLNVIQTDGGSKLDGCEGSLRDFVNRVDEYYRQCLVPSSMNST